MEGNGQISGRTQTVSGDVDEIKALLADNWLPTLYKQKVLSSRTRSYHLEIPAGRADVSVHHTLLGVELKVGAKRRLCPDLATARYLAVFARAGCPDIAVPYDITSISGHADALESSWQRMLLLIDHVGSSRSNAFRSRVRTALIGEIRTEIQTAGAGTPIPQFKESTKQRRWPAKS
jgi:hypothetical protein